MLRRLPKGHDRNALHADIKGFFEMPHADLLVRISLSGAASASFDFLTTALVAGKEDFRMAYYGAYSQNGIIQVSQKGMQMGH
jgi:hypothetical protein